jgi:hypothetical protein
MSDISEKPCRMCEVPMHQGRGRSREHVIPDWIQQAFRLSREMIAYSPLESEAISSSLQLSQRNGETPRRQHNFGSLLLGSVCKSCNDGWMSALETRARPDLLRLMHGEPGAVLDPMGLALWALKTAFTLTLATDPPIGRVPRLHGRWPEKEQGRLPPGVSVLLHRSAEVGWWFSSVSTAIVEVAGDDPRLNLDGQRRNAYCYFLHLGRALLIVRYWPDNRSVLTYDHARFELLGTGATAVAAPADAPPGQRDPLFDLMMAMRIRMDLSGRRPTDFCLCGSGVAAALCAGADHKIDQAGNWGWIT